jgi:hypothetical protein
MTSPLQQKLKVTGPVVVTANRLADGAVIYRTGEGGWSTDLAQAAVVTTAPAASELLAGALADKLKAVDAYVAPVTLTPEQRVLPGNLRERIRSNGPTVAPPGAWGVTRGLDHASRISSDLRNLNSRNRLNPISSGPSPSQESLRK